MLSPLEAERVLAEMSPREREVTGLLADGLSNAAIAERLGLSERTVRGHRNNAYRKLRVHNLRQLKAVLGR